MIPTQDARSAATAHAHPEPGNLAAARRPRFPAIDILRAAAALLVLVYHVIEVGQWTSFPSSGPLLSFRVGWMGVDLFFVISGFVIGLSALQGYKADGPAFRGPFARRRLWRIVPLYALTAVLFVLLVNPSLLSLPRRTLALHLASHAAFLHNLHPSTHGSIDGPNWSVALEMQFYLAMLVLTPWLVRRRPLTVLTAMVLASWAWRGLVVWVIGAGEINAHRLQVYSSQLPGTLDAFAFGIVLAMILAAPERNPACARLLKATWRNFAIWSLAFGLLLWLTMGIFWSTGYWDDAAMIVFWRTLLAATFGSAVAAAATLPSQRLLLLAPLGYLGEISYGLYLWHLPVLLTLTARASMTRGALLAGGLAATIALAALSWHFLEKPLVRRSHERQAPRG